MTDVFNGRVSEVAHTYYNGELFYATRVKAERTFQTLDCLLEVDLPAL